MYVLRFVFIQHLALLMDNQINHRLVYLE